MVTTAEDGVGARRRAWKVDVLSKAVIGRRRTWLMVMMMRRTHLDEVVMVMKSSVAVLRRHRARSEVPIRAGSVHHRRCPSAGDQTGNRWESSAGFVVEDGRLNKLAILIHLY